MSSFFLLSQECKVLTLWFENSIDIVRYLSRTFLVSLLWKRLENIREINLGKILVWHSDRFELEIVPKVGRYIQSRSFETVKQCKQNRFFEYRLKETLAFTYKLLKVAANDITWQVKKVKALQIRHLLRFKIIINEII